MKPLQFLKLGGSLITDKNTPHSPQLNVMARLAEEIKSVREGGGTSRIVLGHGSGSFGHVIAKKYGTRNGVRTPDAWQGFAAVWFEASTLNHILMKTLHAAGLPAISLPVSAAASARDGQIIDWTLAPFHTALDTGLLPVVYGDVVFDSIRGGTILSTEEIFTHLARELQPSRILLAGIDEGVWSDYPKCTHLIPKITPANWENIAPTLGGSWATDVTGGMASKVQEMLDLTSEIPGLEAIIFSGNQPGNLSAVLRGEILGTQITQ